MKRIGYIMETLSSVIVSPRSGRAFYEVLGEFAETPQMGTYENPGESQKIKLIYPFYQYGEYTKYDPEHTDYYLPGSSIKGALLQGERSGKRLLVDDISVPRDCIVLRHLWKIQYLTEVKKEIFDVFFDHIGVEMLKTKAELQGTLYLEDDAEFTDLLKKANEKTKRKMGQMAGYVRELIETRQNKTVLEKLTAVKNNLQVLMERDDVILIGGYKGLLHSILLDHSEVERKGAIFIDNETLQPHGFVKIRTYKEK